MSLPPFVKNLAGRGYAGANVTLPHKEAALALSQPDDRAEAVGAANTLWLDGATLRSTNTDVEGFLDNLDACAPHWDRDLRTAVVLGAGGAARAVVYGLVLRGAARIIVVNRSADRAAALRGRFGESVYPAPWGERDKPLRRRGACGQYDDARHGTSAAGLRSTSRGCRVTPLSPTWCMSRCSPRCLRRPSARGLRTADGLGMLLHQAVRGFALWFGKKAGSDEGTAGAGRGRSRGFHRLAGRNIVAVFGVNTAAHRASARSEDSHLGGRS